MSYDTVLGIVSEYNPCEDLLHIRTKSGDCFKVSSNSLFNYVQLLKINVLKLQGDTRTAYIDINSIESFYFC